MLAGAVGAPASYMDTAFQALGIWVVAHRRLVLAVWVVLFVLGIVFAPRVQEVFERQETTSGTGDSQEAARIIADRFESRSGFSEMLVLQSQDVPVDDPRYAESARSLIDAARATGVVSDTHSFFESGDRSLVAEDGRTTYVELELRSQSRSRAVRDAGKLLDAV